MPLLGFVPDESDDRELVGDVTTALVESPHSMMAESFRQIRSQLSAQTRKQPGQYAAGCLDRARRRGDHGGF